MLSQNQYYDLRDKVNKLVKRAGQTVSLTIVCVGPDGETTDQETVDASAALQFLKETVDSHNPDSIRVEVRTPDNVLIGKEKKGDTPMPGSSGRRITDEPPYTEFTERPSQRPFTPPVDTSSALDGQLGQVMALREQVTLMGFESKVQQIQNTHTREMDKLERQLEKRDDQIEALQKEKAALEKQNAALEKELDEAYDKIEGQDQLDKLVNIGKTVVAPITGSMMKKSHPDTAEILMGMGKSASSESTGGPLDGHPYASDLQALIDCTRTMPEPKFTPFYNFIADLYEKAEVIDKEAFAELVNSLSKRL